MTANGLDTKGVQITRRPSRRYQRRLQCHRNIPAHIHHRRYHTTACKYAKS